MAKANKLNPHFYPKWTQDPAWADLVEKGDGGKLMPFKSGYTAGAVEAISTIRSRFHQFKGHALILRSGKDEFEAGI